MRAIAPKSVPLIIADPPYNLGKDFGIGVKHSDLETWLKWSRSWVTAAVDCLAENGNILIYGIHSNACFIQVLLYELGLDYRRQIIWHYENGWSQYKNAPACHYEPLLWFSRGKQSTYHVIREPYKSSKRLKHTITKNGKVWTPHPDGRQAGDVWKFPVLAGKRFADERVDHPTQKPLSISRRIIKHFSNPGDHVLIPFVGSGSECVAASELDRIFFGTDLNSKYLEIAKGRLSGIAV